MSRTFLIVISAVVAGCATSQTEPPAPVAFADAAAIAQAATVVEITEHFASTTVCRKVTPTGTRMSRGEICTAPVDPNSPDVKMAQDQQDWMLNQLGRNSERELARSPDRNIFTRGMPR
jgi:hypothetical protein